MQQEVRFEIAMQGVDELFIIAGAQRGDDQPLGFATGEQSRSMGARQQAGFADNGADGIQGAAINPAAMLDDIAAHHARFQFLQGGAKVGIFQLLFGQMRLDRVLCGGHGGNTFLLVGNRIGGAHASLAHRFHGIVDRGVIRGGKVHRLFGAIFGQINDQVDDRLKRGVRKGDCAQHFFLGQLIGL